MRIERTALIFLTGCASLLTAQTMIVPKSAQGTNATSTVPVPQYLVYRHFLGWVNALDGQATAAGATDPHEFAKPFKQAGLASADLDALRGEAKLLDAELTQHNARVKATVAAYRRNAQKVLNSGGPLPPPPVELHQLEAARTAILVQHMVRLQTALGPDKSAQLDAYLKHSFAPHISLKALGHAPAAPSFATQAQAAAQ